MAALVLALAPSPLHPQPLRLVHCNAHGSIVLIRLAHTQYMTCADGGGALLDGTLDEAAEHAAFRQAVAAWRQGEKEAVNKGSCYQCYRLFYKVSQPRRCSQSMGASFTSACCLPRARPFPWSSRHPTSSLPVTATSSAEKNVCRHTLCA